MKSMPCSTSVWKLSRSRCRKRCSSNKATTAIRSGEPFARFLISSAHHTDLECRYKARGTIATDLNGTRDTVEFLNIAQDDALAWPRAYHRTYPSTVNAHMDDTIVPFVRKSMAVNNTMLDIFERQLGLPKGSLAELHATDTASGSEARVVKTPPNQSSAGIGAHTDFGTLVSSCGGPSAPATYFHLGRRSCITASAGSKFYRRAPRSGFT